MEARTEAPSADAQTPDVDASGKRNGDAAVANAKIVDPQILAASSLLTSFLRDSPAKGDGPDSIRLPLRLSEGRVSIGPIRTPLRLPPLY